MVGCSSAIANLLITLIVIEIQAHQQPQRGLGKHFCGNPKHFRGAPLGRKFLNFFKMVHSGVFYISERQHGPQMSWGLG